MDEYWHLNPLQFAKYIKVYRRKELARIREKDALNHFLGIYISAAVNNPKEYPQKPFLAKKTEDKPKSMTAEEMERMARRNTIRVGGTVKRGN